ncbi:hypothetical protein C455_00167 [Haloferax larsenii JCM 13917]|nr:hypothetical protein C455_00167 [Haloferax larsenii JCM 13917]
MTSEYPSKLVYFVDDDRFELLEEPLPVFWRFREGEQTFMDHIWGGQENIWLAGPNFAFLGVGQESCICRNVDALTPLKICSNLRNGVPLIVNQSVHRRNIERLTVVIKSAFECWNRIGETLAASRRSGEYDIVSVSDDFDCVRLMLEEFVDIATRECPR